MFPPRPPCGASLAHFRLRAQGVRIVRRGDERAVPFPKTRITHADRNAPNVPGTRDFSFSGLKTSVLRHVSLRRAALGLSNDQALPDSEVDDICASFQRVVVETLLDALFDAAKWYGARSVGIAGGVSANSRLRADSRRRGETRELPVFIPGIELSTDNAAMIAAAGTVKLEAGERADLDLNADVSLRLQNIGLEEEARRRAGVRYRL